LNEKGTKINFFIVSTKLLVPRLQYHGIWYFGSLTKSADQITKNPIRKQNFEHQMWHKFPGLRMKNETIFSNDDQKTGYDSKKMVCSAFGLQGCEC
jgi:hypothetical protein